MATDLRTRIDQRRPALPRRSRPARDDCFAALVRRQVTRRARRAGRSHAGVVPGESPLLALAIVEVRLRLAEPRPVPPAARLQSRVGQAGRPAIIAATEGWMSHTTRSPTPSSFAGSSSLVRRRRARSTLGEATLVFRQLPATLPGQRRGALRRPSRWVRSSRTARSCLDERLALKFYRRIEAGMNPELEILRLPHRAGLRAHRRPRGLHLLRGQAARGDARDPAGNSFRPTGTAGSSHSTRSLRIRLAPGAPAGWVRSRAELHNALASDPVDQYFAPEEPSTEALALDLALRSTRRSSGCSQPCPTSRRSRPCRGRGEEVRDWLRSLTHIGSVGRVIRHHGDYHLGQALWTTERGLADSRLRGRAGSLGAGPAAQALAAAGCRGMLRSFAYAASASVIQRNVEPPEAGRSNAALSSSRATWPPSSRRCCHPTGSRSSGC